MVKAVAFIIAMFATVMLVVLGAVASGVMKQFVGAPNPFLHLMGMAWPVPLLLAFWKTVRLWKEWRRIEG